MVQNKNPIWSQDNRTTRERVDALEKSFPRGLFPSHAVAVAISTAEECATIKARVYPVADLPKEEPDIFVTPGSFVELAELLVGGKFRVIFDLHLVWFVNAEQNPEDPYPDLAVFGSVNRAPQNPRVPAYRGTVVRLWHDSWVRVEAEAK